MRQYDLKQKIKNNMNKTRKRKIRTREKLSDNVTKRKQGKRREEEDIKIRAQRDYTTIPPPGRKGRSGRRTKTVKRRNMKKY